MATRRNSQERLQVLRMIDEGKITAEEGFQLLEALDPTTGGIPRNSSSHPSEAFKGKLVRMQISDLATGRSKAMATVPLRLLEVGLRIASHYAPGLKDMDPENLLDALVEGADGRIIEVVDQEKLVKVELLVE